MAWYEQWFDRDEYELVYRNRDESEARKLVDLIEERAGLSPGARILDVGCGRGRHAVEFAERGYEVTGLDLSERSLEVARERAVEAGVDIELIRGDMREPVAHDAFDVVVNLFTAFGYFEKRSGHQRAIRAMATALKPGGTLVQDFLNAPYVRDTLVEADRKTVDDTRIVQERWISDNRINKEITLVRGDESHAFIESVALLDLDDFRSLYDQAGLDIEHIAGTYTGDTWSNQSPRLILFSRPRS